MLEFFSQHLEDIVIPLGVLIFVVIVFRPLFVRFFPWHFKDKSLSDTYLQGIKLMFLVLAAGVITLALFFVSLAVWFEVFRW